MSCGIELQFVFVVGRVLKIYQPALLINVLVSVMTVFIALILIALVLALCISKSYFFLVFFYVLQF